MQDYKEIVMALRTAKENESHYIPCSRQFADITADAIEQLVKERDAAIADLKQSAVCSNCKKSKICGGLSHGYCGGIDWEWRGV